MYSIRRKNRNDTDDDGARELQCSGETFAGLQGVELGGQVIKRIIVDLVADFPRMNQFASLSPVPGFRDWILDEIGTYVRQRGKFIFVCLLRYFRRAVEPGCKNLGFKMFSTLKPQNPILVYLAAGNKVEFESFFSQLHFEQTEQTANRGQVKSA